MADQIEIKKIDPLNKVGWLHDEKLNSFINNITMDQLNTLYICSTTAMSISHSHSFRRLRNDKKLGAVDKVLIPLTHQECTGFLLSHVSDQNYHHT